jgi:hypothetical protein
VTTCPIDARPLIRPPTGRPPTFCSVACRRVAEAELRRVDRRLAGLEVDLDAADLDIASETYGPGAKAVHKRRAALEAAIVTATARQRLLYARLSDTEEGDEPT